MSSHDKIPNIKSAAWKCDTQSVYSDKTNGPGEINMIGIEAAERYDERQGNEQFGACLSTRTGRLRFIMSQAVS